MTHDNRRIASPPPGWGRGASVALVLVCLGLCRSGLAQPSAPSGAQPPAAKVPIPLKIQRYCQRLVEKYDANGDRKLDQSEWSRMDGTPSTADLDRDGFVTASELADRVARYGRRRKIRLMPALSGGKIALPSLLNPAIGPDAAPAEQPKPAPGAEDQLQDSSAVGDWKTGRHARANAKFHVPRTQLPPGLPPWFLPRDADGDGQLTMAEYAPEATQSQLDEFARFDRNGDGLLTAQECAQGPEVIRPDVAKQKKEKEKEAKPSSVEGPVAASTEEASKTVAEEAAPNAATQGAPTSAGEREALKKTRRSRSKRLLKP